MGNILRPAFVTIISVPNWWNSSQSGFASKAAPAPTSAGWSGRLAPNSSTEDAPSLLGWWSPWWWLLLLLSFRGSTVGADEDTGFATGCTGTLIFVGLGLSDRFTLPALCKQAERMTIQRGSTSTLDLMCEGYHALDGKIETSNLGTVPSTFHARIAEGKHQRFIVVPPMRDHSLSFCT